VSSQQTISVAACGADSTASQCSTEAIQSCIDRAAQVGGTVVFPKGRYLSGGLILRSGVTLQFLEGSELLGISDVEAYPQRTIWKDSLHPLPHRALLLGENVENVALLGPGTLNGQGGLFSGDGQSGDKYLRPVVIHIRNGRHIRVENLKLKNSAIWMQSYERCEDLRIHGLTVDNVSSHCNDGLDIVSCRDVVISNCRLCADDDGLCFKSFENVPCESIEVRDCFISSHCNAIKIGTESYGDFRHIRVSHCVVSPMENTQTFWGCRGGLSGILVSSMDGAVVEDVCFDHIRIQGTRCPVFMRLGDRGRVYNRADSRKQPGSIRAISFQNIEVSNGGSMGLEISAIPGTRIEEVTFAECHFEFTGGGPVEPEWTAPCPVPEVDAAAYPNPGIHGYPPSWAMFVRRVAGLKINGGSFGHRSSEIRPAIIADDVQNLKLDGVKFPENGGQAIQWIPQGNERPQPVFSKLTNPRLLSRYQR
jgi:polygalacturonase